MAEVENFNSFRDIVANLPHTDIQLNLIKDHFRGQIDSPRRFDRITTLNSLIRILEKRDVINNEDKSSLELIALLLQRNDVIPANAENGQIPFQKVFKPFDSRVVLPQFSNDPIRKVDEIIGLEIGQKWNDLARHLDIPEGFIDELEQRYHGRVSQMMHEILRYFRANRDERYWRVNLCTALGNARRRDLSIKVQEVFAMHGLM